MAWKLRAGLETLEDKFDFSGVCGVREALEVGLKGLFCKGFFSASSKSQSQAKESKGVVGVKFERGLEVGLGFGESVSLKRTPAKAGEDGSRTFFLEGSVIKTESCVALFALSKTFGFADEGGERSVVEIAVGGAGRRIGRGRRGGCFGGGCFGRGEIGLGGLEESEPLLGEGLLFGEVDGAFEFVDGLAGFTLESPSGGASEDRPDPIGSFLADDIEVIGGLFGLVFAQGKSGSDQEERGLLFGGEGLFFELFEGFACGGGAVWGDCAEVGFGELGADIEASDGFGEEELLLCGLDERGHLLLEEFFLLLEAVEILGGGVLEVLEFLLEGRALWGLRRKRGERLSDGFDLLAGVFLLLLIEEEGEVEGFDAGELLLGASESESKERAISFDGFDLFELFGGALPSGFVEGVLLDVDFLEKVFGGGAGFEKVEANPERLAPRGLEEIKATAGGREKE